MAETQERFVVVPRLGLDIGGDQIRFRPTFELVTSPVGHNGMDIDLALAVRW